MRHIDSFCHYFPQSIFKLMSQTAGGTTDVGKRMQGVRTIYDLDARFRMMDPFDDYTQVLSLGLPPLEGMVGPDKTPTAEPLWVKLRKATTSWFKSQRRPVSSPTRSRSARSGA